MGCVQGSPKEDAKSPSFTHVKTQSGNVYIANNEALVVWEYLEDINTANWKQYSYKISHQINAAYNTQAPKCQFADKSLNRAYEIDFNLMLETNVVTGWQRKVRIQPQQMITQKSHSSVQHNNNHHTQHQLDHIIQQEQMRAMQNNHNKNKNRDHKNIYHYNHC